MSKVIATAFCGMLLASSTAFAAPFTSANLNLQFETPESWTAEESGERSDASIFMLPKDPQARTYEGTGMHIYLETPYDVDLPADLSGVMAYFRAVQDISGGAYTVVSEEDVTIGGYPAKKITYTGQYNSENVKGPARHVEFYTYGPTRFLYNISYSSLDATFDKYWPEAKTIIDSIRFNS